MVPLKIAKDLIPQQVFGDVFSIANDENKRFFGMGAVQFETSPDLVSERILGRKILSPKEDYVVCITGGRKQFHLDSDANLRNASPQQLKKAILHLLDGWPESTRKIVEHIDESSLSFIEMFSSIPFDLAPADRVAMLGDSIHVMSPSLGRGANIAMRDAASLVKKVLETDLQNVGSTNEMIRSYEREMTAYGFDVVRKAVAMGARIIGQEPLPE